MASSAPLTVVEHVVLFKLRDDSVPAPELEAWLTNVRALHQLEGVLYLHVGAVLSNPLSGGWTHVLYGRYRDKDALDAYSVHPWHLQIVADGSAIFVDKLAVDWEAGVDAAEPGTDIEAARIVLLEWKQGVEEDQIAALTRELGDSAGVTQYTAGLNFSPGRAKGFQWGFAAQCSSAKELEEKSRLDLLSQSGPIIERALLLEFRTNDGPTARI